MSQGAKLSRRELIKSGLGGLVLVGASGISEFKPRGVNPAQSRTDGDLILVNGKFVDGRGVAGSTMTIKNGRIVSVGQAPALGPNAQNAPEAKVIDLGGRTAIPGFFDAHVHYTRAGINPGHEARRIERAFSIAEFQETIARRAESVPPGEFITC